MPTSLTPSTSAAGRAGISDGHIAARTHAARSDDGAPAAHPQASGTEASKALEDMAMANAYTPANSRFGTAATPSRQTIARPAPVASIEEHHQAPVATAARRFARRIVVTLAATALAAATTVIFGTIAYTTYLGIPIIPH